MILEKVKHTTKRVRRTYDAALAEFPAKYREVVHQFAHAEDGDWNRCYAVRWFPALALQLAIDPTLKDARWLLDEHYPFAVVAAEARLAVPRHTRPARLRVVGRKVRLIKPIPKEIAN